jgi:hypothetical protein
MRAILLVACAVLALGMLFHATRAASDDDALDRALENLETARSSDNIDSMCKAVSALASVQDSKVDRALRDIAVGRYPDRVCAAAARSLGLRGGRGSLTFLMRLVKPFRDRPYAMIGVIEGIGAFRSPRSVDTLYEEAQRFMLTQEKVSLAAIDALGRIRTKHAIERLISLLLQTERRVGYGPDRPQYLGPTSSETVEQLATYKAPIVAGLQRLTGEGLVVVDDWNGWWRNVRSSFRLPPAPPDPNRRLGYRDDKLRFEAMRPTAAWRWTDHPEPGMMLTCERLEAGEKQAWLSVHMHSTLEKDPISVPGMLEAQRKGLRTRFTAVHQEDWDGTGRCAGRKASLQRVDGVLDGVESRLAQAVLLYKSRMYVIRWVVTEKAKREIGEETTRFVESIRLLK